MNVVLSRQSSHVSMQRDVLDVDERQVQKEETSIEGNPQILLIIVMSTPGSVTPPSMINRRGTACFNCR